MNLSIVDVGGEILVVSQFTLYADTRGGNRPSFTMAAPPEVAEKLYSVYVDSLRHILGGERVKTGKFGAMMSVEIINDGPVTIELKSEQDDEK
jgi:D-tyrosyl-tRNA(Tyr) deacylase